MRLESDITQTVNYANGLNFETQVWATSQLAITAANITSSVAATYATKGEVATVSTQLTQTASSLTATINGVGGRVTAIEANINGLSITTQSGKTIIGGGEIRTGKYYNLTGRGYIEIGSPNTIYGDFAVHSESGATSFQVLDYSSDVHFWIRNTRFVSYSGLTVDGQVAISLYGGWDFSAAKVKGITAIWG